MGVAHMCSQHASTTTIYLDKLAIDSSGLGASAALISMTITDSTVQSGSGVFLCLGVELFYNVNIHPVEE